MAKIAVAPLVGAWIEIFNHHPKKEYKKVAPLVGAWIEIKKSSSVSTNISVAPLVGAWIEIPLSMKCNNQQVVAPLVGAWIEICWTDALLSRTSSLPSWERGLKCPVLLQS